MFHSVTLLINESPNMCVCVCVFKNHSTDQLSRLTNVLVRLINWLICINLLFAVSFI